MGLPEMSTATSSGDDKKMNRSRGMPVLSIVLPVLAACTGLHGGHDTQANVVSSQLSSLLAKGMEARGEVAFGRQSNTLRHRIMGLLQVGATAQPSDSLPTRLTIVPVDSLDAWDTAADFLGGHLSAVVTLKDGDLPSLHLTRGTNLIYMFSEKSNGGYQWSARVANGTLSKLEVSRFTYKGLDSTKDYPGTARLDWTGADTNRTVVLGIRCGMAWCLVGSSKFSETADPSDPDSTGALHTPNYRRVRGWFDRKILDDTRVAWIYPDSETSEINSQGDYDKAWRHSMVIHVDGQPEKHFEISRPKFAHIPYTERWRAKLLGSSDEIHVRHVDMQGKMPAAARWGASHTDGIIHPFSADVGALSKLVLGDAWVRCASGCCSATLVF